MFESLNGKTAVITGATGRLCKTISLALAQYGVKIAAVGRNEEAARALMDELDALGADAMYSICDITDDDDRKKLFADVKERFGTIDILINGAVAWQKNPFLETESGAYQHILNVNVVSPLMLAIEAAKEMIASGHGGRIINIASAGAYRSSKDSVCYDTSKTALVAETWAMACELGKYGITANCVAPGMTLVENEHRPEQLLEKNRLKTPTQSLSTAKNIADTVIFLASDESCNINGVTIPVEGGLLRVNM